MPMYMVQGSYTTEGWAAIVKNPQDRTKIVQEPIKKLGGKVEKFYFAFGDFDIVGFLEFPDNISAAAIAMAFAAGGALKSVRTTPLLTAEEAISAMKKAGNCGYKSAVASAGK